MLKAGTLYVTIADGSHPQDKKKDGIVFAFLEDTIIAESVNGDLPDELFDATIFSACRHVANSLNILRRKGKEFFDAFQKECETGKLSRVTVKQLPMSPYDADFQVADYSEYLKRCVT